MKKYKVIPLISLLFLQLLTGCKNNDSSDDDENIDVSYTLEENEKEPQISIKKGTLRSLSDSSITIPNITNLKGNPFSSGNLFGETYINYPSSELLNNQNILYTSSYYSRNTFERNDECVEYTLCKDDNTYKVVNIKKNGNTFIPFNGFVLSLSKDCNVTYNIGDVVDLIGDIQQYKIGFYNQDGNRIVVTNTNSISWTFSGVNLYDNNTLDKVSALPYTSISSINFLYDKKTSSYKVDRFRYLEKNGKIYTNVNDGFVLMGSNNSDYLSNDNIALLEGVRFNKNDEIKVEDEALVLDEYHEFSLNSTNSYKYQRSANVDTINFSINELDYPSTTSPWGYEISVNKNGYIIEVGSHVNYNEDCTIYSLTAQSKTTAETLNLLFSEVFLIGSKISVINNSLYVDNSLETRSNTVEEFVNYFVSDKMYEYEMYNYAYNYEKLEEIKKNINHIINEKKSLSNKNDITLRYRQYTLIGKLMQQYYLALSACNRNEAVQVKSCWYIEDFDNNDYSIDTIRKNLLRIKEANFNEIIVGVINNGTSYYNNSKYFELNNKLESKKYGEFNNDFIKAITDEAHKLNIKVFACFTPFTSGLENTFAELKDAFALTVEGKDSVQTSQGIVKMLDPANATFKEKTQLVIDDILASNPTLDGLHLDCIRYGADNNQVNYMTGVTEAARIGFNQYCIDNKLSYSTNTLTELRNKLKGDSKFFYAFNSYQQTLITDTVKLIKDVCLEYSKPLTCAVADNYNLVKTWKCQDWGKWAKDKIVDGLYLMDYYFDEFYVDKYFKDMAEATHNNCLLVSGIDPSYANLSAIFYPQVIKGAIKDNRSSGYAIFGTHTQNAKKDGWDLVKDSSWIDSISPYDSLYQVVNASFTLLLKRCDDIYIKYGNQTSKQKEELNKDINSLLAIIDKENKDTCTSAIDYLMNMYDKDYAANDANNRIKEQLLYIRKLIETKMNILSK